MPAYNPNGYDPADYQPPIGPNTPGYFGPGDGVSSPLPNQAGGAGGLPGTNGGGGGGGGSPFDFLQNLLSGGGNMPLGLSSLLPAILTGAHGLYNSKQYMENAREAADRASPVSTETRQGYQKRLEQLYTDPTAFLESNPEFMATQRLGLQRLGPQNAARGLHGTGKATTDELTFLSDLGSRFVNQERDDLMHMSGFQFDPANAGNMLMRGGEQEIQARTNALAAMLYPFGAGQGPGRGGDPNNRNNGGGGPNGLHPNGRHPGSPNGAPGTSNMLNRISQLPPSSLTPALFQALGMIQRGIPGLFNPDPDVVNSLGQLGITVNPDGSFTGANDFGTGGSVDNPFGTPGDPYGLGTDPDGYGNFGPIDPFGPQGDPLGTGSMFDPTTGAGVGFGSEPFNWEGLSDSQWNDLFGDGGGGFSGWFTDGDAGTDWTFGF
jgi:hypothetical protein